MPDRVVGAIDLKVGFGEELSQCGLKSYIVEYLNAYNIPYSTDYSIGQMITLLTEKINSINPYADCGIVSEPQRFYGNYDEAVVIRDIEGTCTIPGAVDTIEQRVVFTAGDIVINGEDEHYWMAMVDKPESEPTPAGHLAGEWCDITDMCEKFDLLFPFTIEYDSEGVPHIIEGRSIIVRVEDLEACCVEVKGRLDTVEACCDDVRGQLDDLAEQMALVAPVITVIDGNDNITVGDDWVDAGATADDNGTDVTSSIVVTGDVDTSVAGTYIIQYTITTSNGSDTKMRSVVVGASTDTGTGTGTGTTDTPPTVTINPGTDTITEGDDWVDAGAVGTDSEGNDLTITTTGTVNNNVAGTYTITYCATDSNNLTTCVDRTVYVEASGPDYYESYTFYKLEVGGTLVEPSKNNVGLNGGQYTPPVGSYSFDEGLLADGYPVFSNYFTGAVLNLDFPNGNTYNIPHTTPDDSITDFAVPEDLETSSGYFHLVVNYRDY